MNTNYLKLKVDETWARWLIKLVLALDEFSEQYQSTLRKQKKQWLDQTNFYGFPDANNFIKKSTVESIEQCTKNSYL